ncbi:MAG: phosphatase PAP2 family protein [Aeromonas sp.]
MLNVLCLLLIFFGFSSPARSAPQPLEASSIPTAAACAVRYHDKLLLVQDRISSRYSLSGGYIDGDETPAQAALRELYEETGLRGEVVRTLGRWQRAQIFACRTLEPIPAQHASGVVSILHAPNLGGEILTARLFTLAQLPVEWRRFPAQIDWLHDRLTEIPESDVHWQGDFVAEGRWLHQAEIPLMMVLQRWLGPSQGWLSISNLFGSSGVQLALIPLLLPLLGWPRLRQLLFVMLGLGLLVQGLKEGIGWPRPFHLQPELALLGVQGFGMPSGHTASALLFWGALLRWWWPRHQQWAMTLALLLAAATGLARVWLGVHFISDVVVGLLLGGVLLMARPYWRVDQYGAAWLLLIITALTLGGFTQSAHLIGIGVAALGIWMGGSWQLTRGGYPPILLGGTTLVGFGVMGAALWALPQLTSSSLMILLGQFLLFFGLGLWLSGGLWWILSSLKHDSRPKGTCPHKGTL